MSRLVEKFSITPVDRFDWRLPDALPIELGHGLAIQNYKGRLPSIDHWDEYLSKDDIRQILQWSVCLEHRYTDLPHMQGAQNQPSQRLLATAGACLRMLIPSHISGNHCLQLEKTPNELNPFNYLRPATSIRLQDCEAFGPEISPSDFDRFKVWIDWIADFAADGQKYLPLWISLNLSETACTQPEKRIHHLLQVMSLEALVSDAKMYGSRAFLKRLLPLVDGLDLYASYRSNKHVLPAMIANQKLLTDVLVLRNEIAHGRVIPRKWLVGDRRQGADYKLSYADELTEAVTALVRFMWQHILDNNLQPIFSDKRQMAAYCEGL